MELTLTPSEIIDMLGGTSKTAALCNSAWSTVSDWRKLNRIPEAKLIVLAYQIEMATAGRWNRQKLFPDVWEKIWPEVKAIEEAEALKRKKKEARLQAAVNKDRIKTYQPKGVIANEQDVS